MTDDLQPLPLVDPDAVPGRVLRAAAPARCGSGAVAVSREASKRLVSIHTFALGVEARETPTGAERFTPCVPGVDPATLGHLDERGVVRVGTPVVSGTVLVGRAAPALLPFGLSPEEQKLREMFGDGPPERDASLRCPPDVRGVVTRAELTPARGKKHPARVDVVIALERELVVGDLLRADDGEFAAVAELVVDLGGADVAWPGRDGELRVHKVRCADDVLHARSIGPYSLVTQQPLGGKAQFGGQPVGEAQLTALRERGAVHTIHELLTVKSDDIDGRFKLYESIVLSKPRCSPTGPASARAVAAELTALGFDVDLEDEAVALRLLTTEAMRARLPGVVRKPETISYSTFQPVPDGLFCEAIFGPLNSAERRGRLGRVELPAPLLHPFAFDAAASLLGLAPRALKAVLYSGVTLDGGAAEHARDTGGHALGRALAALDLAGLASGRGSRADLAASLLRSGTPAEALVVEAWPVLPPDLRPLVPLDGGGFATSDLNDLYRRVINRRNRLARLLELNAPAIIILNEQVQLQQALDALVLNGLRARKITGPQRRPLLSLGELLPEHLRRCSAKRVDYSAEAVAVPCAGLERGRVRLPRAAARELFKPWTYEALEREGHTTTIKSSKILVERRDPRAEAALDQVARGYPVVVFPAERATASVLGLLVEPWDEMAVGLAPSSFDALAIRPGERVAVHVPVDPAALDEVRTRLGHDARPRRVELEPGGWLAAAVGLEPKELGRHLMAAALAGAVDPVEDPIARSMLGRLERAG